jgi:hypothetical protein
VLSMLVWCIDADTIQQHSLLIHTKAKPSLQRFFSTVVLLCCKHVAWLAVLEPHFLHHNLCCNRSVQMHATSMLCIMHDAVQKPYQKLLSLP